MEDNPGQPVLVNTAQHWHRISDARINGVGQTAADLWDSAIAYFMWCDTNPIYKPELIRSGENAGMIAQVPVQRPYTLRGLCLHLGITVDYLHEAARSKEQNEFFYVVKSILDIVHTQVLEGTLTGIYAQVVSIKHLGLDRVDSGAKPNPTVNINVLPAGPKLLTNEQEIEIPADKK
jgi:hypothetical protein